MLIETLEYSLWFTHRYIARWWFTVANARGYAAQSIVRFAWRYIWWRSLHETQIDTHCWIGWIGWCYRQSILWIWKFPIGLCGWGPQYMFKQYETQLDWISSYGWTHCVESDGIDWNSRRNSSTGVSVVHSLWTSWPKLIHSSKVLSTSGWLTCYNTRFWFSIVSHSIA